MMKYKPNKRIEELRLNKIQKLNKDHRENKEEYIEDVDELLYTVSEVKDSENAYIEGMIKGIIIGGISGLFGLVIGTIIRNKL